MLLAMKRSRHGLVGSAFAKIFPEGKLHFWSIARDIERWGCENRQLILRNNYTMLVIEREPQSCPDFLGKARAALAYCGTDHAGAPAAL